MSKDHVFNDREINSPRVTAGLNKPPLTRKNTQAFTARLKPKTKLIYPSVLAFGICDKLPSLVSAPEFAALATWVPLKAKKRKRNVPTNLSAIHQHPSSKITRTGVYSLSHESHEVISNLVRHEANEWYTQLFVMWMFLQHLRHEWQVEHPVLGRVVDVHDGQGGQAMPGGSARGIAVLLWGGRPSMF